MRPAVSPGAVLRYRVLAYVTGVALVVLVFVGIPLKLGGHDQIVAVVGVVHGYLFPVYVLFTLDLSRRARWSIKRTVLIALAGTVPFASFFAERNVVHGLEAAASA
jgi:integral membrane protein